MEQPSPSPGLHFLLALYLPLALFGLGGLVGWFLGRDRRRAAVLAFVVGGLVVFAGYAGLFAWFGVFSLQNEIR